MDSIGMSAVVYPVRSKLGNGKSAWSDERRADRFIACVAARIMRPSMTNWPGGTIAA